MYNTSSFSTRWICFYIQEINILTRTPRSMTKEPPGRRRLCRNPENGPGSTTPLLVQCFNKGRQELLLAGNDIFQDDMLVAVRDIKGFLGQKISVQTAAEKFRRGVYDISHHHEHHIQILLFHDLRQILFHLFADAVQLPAIHGSNLADAEGATFIIKDLEVLITYFFRGLALQPTG